MDKPEPSFREQLEQVRAGVQSLRAILEEFRTQAEQLTTLIVFNAHPELTALDDELDILYRGQL